MNVKSLLSSILGSNGSSNSINSINCNGNVVINTSNSSSFSSNSIQLTSSEDIVDSSIPYQEFNDIDVTGVFTVNVDICEDKSIEVSADKNIIEYIELKFDSDTLHIGYTDNISFEGMNPIIINIKTPELSGIDVSGVSNVLIKNINEDDFSIDVSGSGDAEISGSVDTLSVDLSGMGSIDATKLQASNLKARISGMGDIQAYANEYVKANISGQGDLCIYGNPSIRKIKKTGMGDISFK